MRQGGTKGKASAAPKKQTTKKMEELKDKQEEKPKQEEPQKELISEQQLPNEEKQDGVQVLTEESKQIEAEVYEEKKEEENFEKVEEGQEEQEHFMVVDSKYGDQQINLTDIQNKEINFDLLQPKEEPEMRNLDVNDQLPSHSNRVNIGEFSVGHFKEFQLREELAGLIQKYNKKFYAGAPKPVIDKMEIKEQGTKYQNKAIINPVAVPDPSSAGPEGNYSWMYLMTPYYNKMVNEFNQEMVENTVLKQHFEYYIEMEKEKELLEQNYDLLKKAEAKLLDQVEEEVSQYNQMEQRNDGLEKNLNVVYPERIKDKNEKLESLSSLLGQKDNVVEQLLNEITLIKNEKDDIQNEVLFKKQKIDNYNIEFNSKELEYQRIWEEGLQFKQDMRGETYDVQQMKMENEMLQREINQARQEVAQSTHRYESYQHQITEVRERVQEFEHKLRYANEVISGLEGDNQTTNMDIASVRAVIESQHQATLNIRTNFDVMNSNSDVKGIAGLSGSTASPLISIPKVVLPSQYYKPSMPSKTNINIMPATSKALSQQVGPSNIKNYLSSIKTAKIDLSTEMNTFSSNRRQTGAQRDELKFSPQKQDKRSDSLDMRMQARSFNQDLLSSDNQRPNQFGSQRASVADQVHNIRRQGGSVNRNYVDSMSGLLGMNQQAQDLLSQRALQENIQFPLQKSSGSPGKEVKWSDQQEERDFRNRETDISYHMRESQQDSFQDNRMSMSGSNMGTQTPFQNRLGVTKGGPGNRSSQPQQLNSVKQRQMGRGVKQSSDYEKYREPTWADRMSQLPRQSAYKSSIAFTDDGLTTKFEENKMGGEKHLNPFSIARDYEVDLEVINADDPQAKAQAVKFKQQKIYELQDQRRILQEEMNHISEYSKSVAQRQKRQELEMDLQKMSKRISMLKYDLKKLTSKAPEE